MKYSNRATPEGINNPKPPFWRSFWVMLLSMAVVLAVATWLLGRSGAWLATLVSYPREVALVQKSGALTLEPSDQQRALQGLADALAIELDMQGFQPLSVHYVDDKTVNAFATLGGHLMFHEGLISQLRSENALAMLVAHELAHVKYRHPIASLGQGLAIEAGLSMILGDAEPDIFRGTGFYTRMKFSRDMELDADKAALGAVYRRYGHVAGALGLYEVLLRQASLGSNRYTELLQTHPLTERRIDKLTEMAEQEGWPLEGVLKGMPPAL